MVEPMFDKLRARRPRGLILVKRSKTMFTQRIDERRLAWVAKISGNQPSRAAAREHLRATLARPKHHRRQGLQQPVCHHTRILT
jgi:hypothetical protein